MEEEDPVVQEMDVFLSQSKELYLLQYPLRSSEEPYTADSILAARVCGGGEGVELDVKVRPQGENYSSSRGENYARMVAMGSPDGGYKSNYFDQLTLSSAPMPFKSGRYAVAACKEGALHISQLNGIVQLKPNLSYLDRADVGAKKLEAAASDDGDTTESEGEEAKPVTVRFAKQVNPAKAQKKVGHKLTFTENSKTNREWTNVTYYGVESEEADEERRLLLAGEDAEDQSDQFSMPEGRYLDTIFPKEASRQEESSGTSGAPIGVVSLESIRKLPLKRQVLEVLRSAHMIQFGQLCSLLGVAGGKMGSVLEAVLSCSVLVQGCWVVASHVIFPDSKEAAKRSARDYILWCFSQRRLVPRKDIMGVVKLPNEAVRQMMQTLAEQRFIPQHGWEFKLETDLDFIGRNASIVSKEEEKWRRKHKELVHEINTKSPGSASKPLATPTLDTPPEALAGGGSGRKESGKGQKKPRMKGASTDSQARDKAWDIEEGPKLSVTPSRHTPSLMPQDIAVATKTVSMDTGAAATGTDVGPVPMDTGVSSLDVGEEIPLSSNAENTTVSSVSHEVSPLLEKAFAIPTTSNEPLSPLVAIKREQCSASNSGLTELAQPIKQERAATPTNQPLQPHVPSIKQEASGELEGALVAFCREALGRGVLSLSGLQNKLLLKQTSVMAGHPLGEQGVSDSQLEEGLRLCGAVEVGQPLGIRFFALTHEDQCRGTILEMYQKHKSLKKKQLIDELIARRINIPEKTLVKTLKELCYGKGGHWRLLGT